MVRRAVERGSSRGDLPVIPPPFFLAEHNREISQPATSPIKKTARKKAAGTRLMIAPGQENVFWDALRNIVLSLDRTQSSDERAKAVKFLVELVDMDKARAILRAGLDIPFSHSGVRFDILNELFPIAKNNDVVWDLILYGAGQQNDQVAEGKFFEWFKQAGGRATVD